MTRDQTLQIWSHVTWKGVLSECIGLLVIQNSVSNLYGLIAFLPRCNIIGEMLQAQASIATWICCCEFWLLGSLGSLGSAGFWIFQNIRNCPSCVGHELGHGSPASWSRLDECWFVVEISLTGKCSPPCSAKMCLHLRTLKQGAYALRAVTITSREMTNRGTKPTLTIPKMDPGYIGRIRIHLRLVSWLNQDDKYIPYSL